MPAGTPRRGQTNQGGYRRVFLIQLREIVAARCKISTPRIYYTRRAYDPWCRTCHAVDAGFIKNCSIRRIHGTPQAAQECIQHALALPVRKTACKVVSVKCARAGGGDSLHITYHVLELWRKPTDDIDHILSSSVCDSNCRRARELLCVDARTAERGHNGAFHLFQSACSLAYRTAPRTRCAQHTPLHRTHRC